MISHQIILNNLEQRANFRKKPLTLGFPTEHPFYQKWPLCPYQSSPSTMPPPRRPPPSAHAWQPHPLALAHISWLTTTLAGRSPPSPSCLCLCARIGRQCRLPPSPLLVAYASLCRLAMLIAPLPSPYFFARGPTDRRGLAGQAARHKQRSN